MYALAGWLTFVTLDEFTGAEGRLDLKINLSGTQKLTCVSQLQCLVESQTIALLTVLVTIGGNPRDKHSGDRHLRGQLENKIVMECLGRPKSNEKTLKKKVKEAI